MDMVGRLDAPHMRAQVMKIVEPKAKAKLSLKQRIALSKSA